MLDTHCRKYIQPFILGGANILMKLKFSANQVTILALFLGLATGYLVYLDHPFIGLGLLWISGYLDAVDGTIARTKGSTPFGTVMDITFDRLVEIGIILGMACRYKEFTFILLVLACTIIVSMTIFLVTGTMANKKSEKSFYYQAGLAERSEGFIMFSTMIILGEKAYWVIIIFIIMIVVTVLQRFFEAKKILNN